MNRVNKKKQILLGARIGILYLLAFGFLVVSAYFVLFHNFHELLVDYSLKLVQALVEQSVTTVDYEVRSSQKEAAALADIFPFSAEKEEIIFPQNYLQSDMIRMIYVSEGKSVSSDGRLRDISEREDITQAFAGTTAFYGPYFNEEEEYVICYSAPVYQGDQIVGVLSIEKDGYYFSSLIHGIRFADSGESYIINAEGTDIAVSNQEHMDWVTSQYNADKILEKQADGDARSVSELERKGLNGEKGIGVYDWEGSLCYLVYEPIPSTHWVLLAGLREEELFSMVQSAMSASLTKGPLLAVCILAFLLLTAAIFFWIMFSLKKSAEVNQKLAVIANYDPLTGLMNRNMYQQMLEKLSESAPASFACIYIDVNGLHEVNNHLGHLAGDNMLKNVADTLQYVFPKDSIFRIGGDEFVLFCQNCTEQNIVHKSKVLQEKLRKKGHEISLGTAWSDTDINVNAMVNLAENAMQESKKQFYKNNGKERQLRSLNYELEQMLMEKHDADTFLSILAPEYKGVYFVNLDTDSMRHLYIPSYFELILKEVDDVFSKALHIYSQRHILPEFQIQFEEFCNYSSLKLVLNQNTTAEFNYQKNDGTQIKLQILKFKTYTEQNRETLWIFSTASPIR